MKRTVLAPILISAALITASPALAFDRMLLADCQDTVDSLLDMFAPNEDRAPQMLRAVQANFDGWCQISGGAAGFEDAQFDRLSWRTDATERWTVDGIPPLALQLQITGLRPDTLQGGPATQRAPLTLVATLRQVPDAGQVIVEEAVLSNDLGDEIRLSAAFERLFLSSPSMMQVSVGSAALKAGLASVTLTGRHENPFGFGVSAQLRGSEKAQKEAAAEVISNLPEGVFDAGTRAALTAFASDLPRPRGTLEVQVNSERGLGLMQFGAAAALSLSEPRSTADMAQNLDVLLDGLTIAATWAPFLQGSE